MRVIRIETAIHPRSGAPRPTRDALQALPGAGGVEVLVHTDEGVTGRGECSFGRIGGAPQTLATFVDQILAPETRGRVAVATSPPPARRGDTRSRVRD